jgi:hypothetical protein
MISSVGNVSSKFRHHEIVPAAYQRTGNRNERVSPAMRFNTNVAGVLNNLGYVSNIQRITGISGVIQANFYVNPYTGPNLGYFPSNPTARCLLYLSFETPTVSTNSNSKSEQLIPSGSVAIETFSDGKVNLYLEGIISYSVSNDCLYSPTRAYYASIKINYSGGGLDPNKYYWLRDQAVFNSTSNSWSFYLKDINGKDVSLTSSSGTTNSVISTLHNDYTISNPTNPLAGTPIRDSWPVGQEAIVLYNGDNFINIADGLYIWFRTGYLVKTGNASYVKIYNETFNDFRTTGYGQSNLIADQFWIA